MKKFYINILFICLIMACEPSTVSEVEVSDKPEVLKVKGESIGNPTASGSGMLNIANSSNTLYFSWIEEIPDGGHGLKYATYANQRWYETNEIARGDNWFVNWADFPTMAVFEDGRMAAHYLQKSGEGTFHYDVVLKFYNPETESWSEPELLNTDGLQAEHGFVSLLPLDNGNLMAVWLDGRKTATANSDMESHDHGHAGEMTLRAALFDADFNRTEEWELDGRICDCCQTSATQSGDKVFVVYRDRSDEEIRDISMVTFDGNVWTEPTKLHDDNWNIAGCPVNGPSITSNGENILAAWFTMADGSPKIQYKLSADGGENFGSAIQLNGNPGPGRVQVVSLDNRDSFVAIWLENVDNVVQVLAAEIDNRGEVIEKFIVGESSESRASGFPRVGYNGEGLLFAWVGSEGESAVTTKFVELD